jgi:hypothetical protein
MNLTINVKDITGYPTPVVIATTGVIINIGGVITNDNYTASRTLNPGEVIITVTKPNYYSYTNTFKIFAKDLTIDILLVPIITDVTNSNYHKPFPFFTAYSDLCSFNAYVYSTTSQPFGGTIYYLNTVLKDTARNTVIDTKGPGVFTIKQQNIVLQDTVATNPSILWDLSYNSDVTINEYRPEISVDVSTTSSQIVIGQPVTIQVSANLNKPTDAEQTLLSCIGGEVTYDLYDSQDNLVESVTNDFNLTTPTYTPYVFTPQLPGDYKLKVSLSNCCATVNKILTLSALDILQIEEDDTSVTISNLSINRNLTVTLYNSTGITPIHTDIFPIVISPTGSKSIGIDDGVYILRGNDTLRDYVVILIKYNKIRTCFEEVIKNIICNPIDSCNTKCSCTKNRDKLNRMTALGLEYFSRLQSFYGFNNIYSALSDGQLKDLFETQTIFDTLSKYCSCVPTKIGGCGCSN